MVMQYLENIPHLNILPVQKSHTEAAKSRALAAAALQPFESGMDSCSSAPKPTAKSFHSPG